MARHLTQQLYFKHSNVPNSVRYGVTEPWRLWAEDNAALFEALPGADLWLHNPTRIGGVMTAVEDVPLNMLPTLNDLTAVTQKGAQVCTYVGKPRSYQPRQWSAFLAAVPRRVDLRVCLDAATGAPITEQSHSFASFMDGWRRGAAVDGELRVESVPTPDMLSWWSWRRTPVYGLAHMYSRTAGASRRLSYVEAQERGLDPLVDLWDASEVLYDDVLKAHQPSDANLPKPQWRAEFAASLIRAGVSVVVSMTGLKPDDVRKIQAAWLNDRSASDGDDPIQQ